MSAEITQLITYPIKSCAGVSHDEILINQMGLLGDRQWMLVDTNGLFLSQRKYPSMALIQPKMTSATSLLLQAPGMKNIEVNLSDESQDMSVTVWQDTLQASHISTAADQWFSTYLDVAVRLVKYTGVSHRQIDMDFAKPGQTVAFADGYPVLVTHQSTLDQLNERLSQNIDMSRFRPNIVVNTTGQAWDELNWQGVGNDTITLGLKKPCTRCVMTGIEQQTGIQTGSEVLKTLKQQFAHQNKAVFGINAIPKLADQQPVQLKVGMALKVTQKPHAE